MVKVTKVNINYNKCVSCGFCETTIACANPANCVGCLACYWGCPYEAREIVYVNVDKYVRIEVNGVEYEVPEGITVAKALEIIGLPLNPPGSRNPSLACGTGGCWACAILINGEFRRACITPVREGQKISLNIRGYVPRRIVHGPAPHTVGGKATPWWEVDYLHYVEAAMWLAGCNLRCLQCQNFEVTYDGKGRALTPEEAAKEIVLCHREYGTKGIAVSGGEPTLNRNWLIMFFKEVTRRVHGKVRRHLDSNGTLLTPDYIDELVEAGCNNIGVEPKCVSVETYMKITGLKDRSLAEKYLNTAWKAIEYLNENYLDKVYIGIGLVYNRELVTLDEIAKAGEKIASINPYLQVTVLDYFPAFRRRTLKRPSPTEMIKVKKILENAGLKTVIVQTSIGHIGPGK